MVPIKHEVWGAPPRANKDALERRTNSVWNQTWAYWLSTL